MLNFSDFAIKLVQLMVINAFFLKLQTQLKHSSLTAKMENEEKQSLSGLTPKTYEIINEAS